MIVLEPRPQPSGALSANQPPMTAPMVYCPAAPIFHTLARKQTASPAPISASGIALTITSEGV